MNTDSAELLEALSGRLIVSCQASLGNALRDSPTIARLAAAAVQGGASAIRCGGVGGIADIEAVRAAVDVPVIGLTKEGSTGVYITPTRDSVERIVRAGAEIVAFDATPRPRPDGSSVAELVDLIHSLGATAMADISTLEEGVAAGRAGADLVSTTLSGYTPYTSREHNGPDLELVSALRRALDESDLEDVRVYAEGRYHSVENVRDAFARGADSVVVGTAITDVAWVTASFVSAVDGAR
jgi:N-acylglucosamine-6-phosphate 2-epimerase